MPVYIYDDVPWLPYEGSNISVSSFGYSAQIGRATACIQELKNTTEGDYSARMLRVKEAREYYTYAGVIQQIDLLVRNVHLIKDSYAAQKKGMFLRCTRLPDKEH